MSYFDGFVLAVPTANKQKFIDHATKGDSVFMELGAIRILECWGDDVPTGKTTDFRMAVKAENILTDLFNAYMNEPMILPKHIQEQIALRGQERTVCDYIAGMTDRYAIKEHRRLFAIGEI